MRRDRFGAGVIKHLESGNPAKIQFFGECGQFATTSWTSKYAWRGGMDLKIVYGTHIFRDPSIGIDVYVMEGRR
jgi:hypothetical protein